MHGSNLSNSLSKHLNEDCEMCLIWIMLPIKMCAF